MKMNVPIIFIVLQVLLQRLHAQSVSHEGISHFTNEWVVRIAGGQQIANSLATESGYVMIGEIPGFPGTYRMIKTDHPNVRKRASHLLTERLVTDGRVIWAEQQFAKNRVKRGSLVRVKRNYVPEQRPALFNDELWDQEWYLQDTRTRPDLPKLDLHVLPVYAQGITGKGVRIVILDDGVEKDHQDLKPNWDDDISWDLNDDDPDPSPRYDDTNSNSHGTRCAGEVAMSANNRKCGVGVAFNARIGGIRMLDGPVSDRVEGAGLSFSRNLVDVYSASWGPSDDGRTVEGPGRLALEALYRGVTEGRGGLGNIFVWAAGNGGVNGDNCNCDGYTSSVWTLAIGSASERGLFPWYGERCASTMAVTYSSGAYTDQMIATTDLRNSCTVRHTGTSAAAPLAAGIIALALEVNPALTWRDVQYLVAWTSEWAPLRDNPGWARNAAGLRFNSRFGFGLMNAHGLVVAAANWTSVPPKSVCTIVPIITNASREVSGDSPFTLTFVSNSCTGTDAEINYLEHIELEATISYSVRGALGITLVSPAGTKTDLLTPRPGDTSTQGFFSWRFMSVHCWGERPHGQWEIQISDQTGTSTNAGSVGEMKLILHGTRDKPLHMANGQREYDENYNSVSKKAGHVSVSEVLKELLKEEEETPHEDVNEIGWIQEALLNKLRS